MTSILPELELIPPVTTEHVTAFAAASGDGNPIHLSGDAARAAGLEGPVLHGMFIAGRFETFLERVADHEIAELQVRLVRPAPVGSALAISARPIDGADAGLRLRLLAKTGSGVLVAIAEARLVARSEPSQEGRQPGEAGPGDEP
ncbi:MAG: MaoC family dehydratase [Alphaproteobacteria bacterium]|nr:MaoC family dehydratase [Alphaproteobacteria bacterium]